MNRWIMIIVTTFIGFGSILYVVLYPNYHPHIQNYDQQAKLSLRVLLTTCSMYWAEHGNKKDCSFETSSDKKHPISSLYGYPFKPVPNVILQGSGDERTFIAIARHSKSKRSFSINVNAEIVEVKSKGGE